VSSEGHRLLVSGGNGDDTDGVHDAVRDAVVDLDLGLVRLEQGRRHLEEIFQPASTEVSDA
jgi:ABC-2 type transport system ATP-binding protein